MDAELRKQPTTDEGAYDPNDEIADDPEPGALHDLAGQSSGNQADHQDDEETFTRHVHIHILQIQRISLDKIPPGSRLGFWASALTTALPGLGSSLPRLFRLLAQRLHLSLHEPRACHCLLDPRFRVALQGGCRNNHDRPVGKFKYG